MALTAVVIIIVAVVVVVLVALRKKPGSVPPNGENFVVMKGEIDGHPLFAMIDVSLRNFDDTQELPYFLSVGTRLVSPTEDGLPTRSEADDLNAWEDVVEARLRPQGRLVFIGRVTWKGERELLYYVDKQQPFVETLKSLSDAQSTRPFAFACERDEKWRKADFWFKRH